MSQIRHKKSSLITCLMLSASLTGCATMVMTGQTLQERTKATHTKLDNDVIRNIGYSLSNSSEKQMILLGDKYSYVLTDGLDKVELMTQLNPEYLKLPKVTHVYRNEGDNITTFLDFNYKKSDENYTKEEKVILDKLCEIDKTDGFRPKVYYECSHTLKGKIYKSRPTDKVSYSLSKGRKVEIIKGGTKTYREYENLLVLPMAVALDVVTLPLQLLWLGYAAAVHSSSSN